MIPILQLDPMSLAIWFAPARLGSGSLGEASFAALEAAWLGGDFAAAIQDHAGSEAEAMEAAWVGSCMWHEKRHFYDLCLTSYGAWRLRHMFGIYPNAMQAVGEAARTGTPLAFPLTAHADPYRRGRMGLADPSPTLLAVAAETGRRKASLAKEAAALQSGGASLRIGGDAQMEALALVSQLHCLARLYGAEPASRMHGRFVAKLSRTGLYRWVELAALALGCTRTRADGAIECDLELPTALLYAGLCGQWLPPGTDAGAVLPAERFGRLFHELRGREGGFGLSAEDAGQLVDETAKRLWGRSLLQELTDDHEAMLGFREKYAASGSAAAHEVLGALDDYLRLRGTFLDHVRDRGPSAMSPRAFAADWADRLRPALLHVAPHGETYDPKTETRRVHFGTDLHAEGRAGPVRIAWAWRRMEDAAPGDATGPRDLPAWSYVLEWAAPLSKLALNGRRHALMLYPELDSVIGRLEEAGIACRFVPQFERPEPRQPEARQQAAQVYADLLGMSAFTCDVTGDRIAPGDATLLTPWEFRDTDLPARFLDPATSGLNRQAMLMKDWSEWIVRADLVPVSPPISPPNPTPRSPPASASPPPPSPA